MADGRHASSTPFRIKPPYLIAGGVVIAVGVVLALVLSGGSGSGGGASASVGPTTPAFTFRTTSVTAVPVRAGVKPLSLQGKAKPVAAQISKTMDAIYVAGFLDPSDWQHASYDTVWASFDQGAASEAQKQVDTLTAGTGAGAAFDRITPKSGTLEARVLLDDKDRPFSVLATVVFKAVGHGKAGNDLLISSDGQFVFEQVGGAWKVVSFHVVRDDQAQAPSPSAMPSGSPSGIPS